MIYEFMCEPCSRPFSVSGSMAFPPQARKQRCPSCGKAKAYRIFGIQPPLIKGRRELDQVLDCSKPARSTMFGTGMTAERQRHLQGQKHQKMKSAAQRLARSRRGSKRADDEMRPVGSMSVEMFKCAQRTRGRNFYKEHDGGVKGMLNEFGMSFED